MKGNIYYIKLSVIRSIKTLSSATPYNNKDAKLLLLKLIKSNVAGKIMNRIWGLTLTLTLTFNYDENRACLTTSKQENTKNLPLLKKKKNSKLPTQKKSKR